jgi:2-amino-4-hydroxy-6-hydroxymethyldihydropteridine diphosphokinase
LNAAVLLLHQGEVLQLLEHLQDIEKRLGRVRIERWGPRVIDLDVLWIEGRTIRTPRLVVPHPRLHLRAFALVPLLELVPNARDPMTGERYLVPSGEVRRTEEAL